MKKQFCLFVIAALANLCSISCTGTGKYAEFASGNGGSEAIGRISGIHSL